MFLFPVLSQLLLVCKVCKKFNLYDDIWHCYMFPLIVVRRGGKYKWLRRGPNALRSLYGQSSGKPILCLSSLNIYQTVRKRFLRLSIIIFFYPIVNITIPEVICVFLLVGCLWTFHCLCSCSFPACLDDIWVKIEKEKFTFIANPKGFCLYHCDLCLYFGHFHVGICNRSLGRQDFKIQCSMC